LIGLSIVAFFLQVVLVHGCLFGMFVESAIRWGGIGGSGKRIGRSSVVRVGWRLLGKFIDGMCLLF